MKTIKKEDYLKLVGLLTIAEAHYLAFSFIEKTIANLLGEKKELGGYGHISDMLWCGEFDADSLLEKMDIKVDKK